MTSLRSVLTLGALAAAAAAIAPAPVAAQEVPPPEPVGDMAFVDSGRTQILSRFGATLSMADMRDRGPTHVDAVAGSLGFDWILAFASFGSGSAIVADVGATFDAGAVLGRTGQDLALDDFVMNLDATISIGWRQDLAIETYLAVLVGYRFALQGQAIYLADDLIDRMWHLGYLRAMFRHEFFAVEGGAGFGQGGLMVHGGPRIWLFDSLWIGAEALAWITPGERELVGARAFFELRQE